MIKPLLSQQGQKLLRGTTLITEKSASFRPITGTNRLAPREQLQSGCDAKTSRAFTISLSLKKFFRVTDFIIVFM